MAATFRQLRSRRISPMWSLDGVVEPLIEKTGRSLMGSNSHPWAVCRGVLRLSVGQPTETLTEEFLLLKMVLMTAMEVLGDTRAACQQVETIISDSKDSAVGLLDALKGLKPSITKLPFGGIVVEVFLSQPSEESPASAHLPMNAQFQHPL